MGNKSNLVAAAGLFATAEVLAREEWSVAATSGNPIRTDLLAQQTSLNHLTAAIQVKTRTAGDFHLDISEPSPTEASLNEWVVLVSLGGGRADTEFHIVPRNHVCAVTLTLAAIRADEGKAWPRKLISEQEFDRYKNRWDLMQAPAEEAPWLLPPWVFDGLAAHPQPSLTAPRNPSP